MALVDDLIAERTRIMEALENTPIRPSYSVDGQSLNWGSHRKDLLDQLQQLNEMITALSPYVISTRYEV